MAAYIKTIIDKNGDIIYPQTKTNAIFDDNGNQLTNVIDNKANKSDVFTKEEVNNLMTVDTTTTI